MYLLNYNGDEFKSDSLEHIDGTLRAMGVGVQGMKEDLRDAGAWQSDEAWVAVVKVDGRTITDVQWLG